MSLSYAVDSEFNYLFKILIIGDSGVGKTSILQRFANDYFCTNYVATIGVDFHIRTIDVDSKRCKLQVWDTAGQDRFKCVVSTFYRGAHGVMICFDITDKESFTNVDAWLEEINKFCPDHTPVFLVGTKSDLQFKRTVSYSDVKAYADKKGLSYIETSAKTKENIDNCFFDFTRTLVTHVNGMEMKHKDDRKSSADVIAPHAKTIPVTTGGCIGGSKCNI